MSGAGNVGGATPFQVPDDPSVGALEAPPPAAPAGSPDALATAPSPDAAPRSAQVQWGSRSMLGDMLRSKIGEWREEGGAAGATGTADATMPREPKPQEIVHQLVSKLIAPLGGDKPTSVPPWIAVCPRKSPDEPLAPYAKGGTETFQKIAQSIGKGGEQLPPGVTTEVCKRVDGNLKPIGSDDPSFGKTVDALMAGLGGAKVKLPDDIKVAVCVDPSDPKTGPLTTYIEPFDPEKVKGGGRKIEPFNPEKVKGGGTKVEPFAPPKPSLAGEIVKSMPYTSLAQELADKLKSKIPLEQDQPGVGGRPTTGPRGPIGQPPTPAAPPPTPTTDGPVVEPPVEPPPVEPPDEDPVAKYENEINNDPRFKELTPEQQQSVLAHLRKNGAKLAEIEKTHGLSGVRQYVNIAAGVKANFDKMKSGSFDDRLQAYASLSGTHDLYPEMTYEMLSDLASPAEFKQFVNKQGPFEFLEKVMTGPMLARLEARSHGPESSEMLQYRVGELAFMAMNGSVEDFEKAGAADGEKYSTEALKGLLAKSLASEDLAGFHGEKLTAYLRGMLATATPEALNELVASASPAERSALAAVIAGSRELQERVGKDLSPENQQAVVAELLSLPLPKSAMGRILAITLHPQNMSAEHKNALFASLIERGMLDGVIEAFGAFENPSPIIAQVLLPGLTPENAAAVARECNHFARLAKEDPKVADPNKIGRVAREKHGEVKSQTEEKSVTVEIGASAGFKFTLPIPIVPVETTLGGSVKRTETEKESKTSTYSTELETTIDEGKRQEYGRDAKRWQESKGYARAGEAVNLRANNMGEEYRDRFFDKLAWYRKFTPDY